MHVLERACQPMWLICPSSTAAGRPAPVAVLDVSLARLDLNLDSISSIGLALPPSSLPLRDSQSKSLNGLVSAGGLDSLSSDVPSTSPMTRSRRIQCRHERSCTPCQTCRSHMDHGRDPFPLHLPADRRQAPQIAPLFQWPLPTFSIVSAFPSRALFLFLFCNFILNGIVLP